MSAKKKTNARRTGRYSIIERSTHEGIGSIELTPAELKKIEKAYDQNDGASPWKKIRDAAAGMSETPANLDPKTRVYLEAILPIALSEREFRTIFEALESAVKVIEATYGHDEEDERDDSEPQASAVDIVEMLCNVENEIGTARDIVERKHYERQAIAKKYRSRA